jgi:hypothetical protein
VDIISAPRPRLKVESTPMRPPQASQIETISSSTGMLPWPSQCSHINGFRRHPNIAPQALTLHFFLDQHLAFFAIRRFAQYSRYGTRLFVLEFNDEFPFGADGGGDHVPMLYRAVLSNTRYCVSYLVMPYFDPAMILLDDVVQVLGGANPYPAR